MIMQRARATQFHAPIARCCEAGIDTLNYRVPFKFRDSDATRARPARRVRAPARARVSLLAIGGAASIGLRVRFRRSDPRKRNLNFGGLGRRRS